MKKEISLRERIRINLISAMEKAGINQVQLAEKLNISKGTVNNWIKGNNSPDVDMVPKICKALEISIISLYTPLDDFDDIPKKQSYSLSKDAIQIAKYYDELTLINQYAVKHVITAMTETEKKIQSECAAPDNTRFIDLFDLPVSAGTGVYLDGYNSKPIKIVNTPEAAKADYALRVSGDSMEPQYYNGDIVLIKTTPDVPQGAVGVFIHNGEGFIKQRDNSHLCSLNPKYPPIKATEYTITKGQVLGKAILA